MPAGVVTVLGAEFGWQRASDPVNEWGGRDTTGRGLYPHKVWGSLRKTSFGGGLNVSAIFRLGILAVFDGKPTDCGDAGG
jgi:hypothetical protein